MSFDANRASQERVADLAGLSASKLPNTLSSDVLTPDLSSSWSLGRTNASQNASSEFAASSVVYNASDQAYTFAKHDVVHLSQCLAALIGHGFWIGLWFTILVGLWLLSYPARARKAQNDSFEMANLTSLLHALSRADDPDEDQLPLAKESIEAVEDGEKASTVTAAGIDTSNAGKNHERECMKGKASANEQDDKEDDDDDGASEGRVVGPYLAAMLSTSAPSYDRTLCLLIFGLQQINVILIMVASTVHVTKQFQASNDMFAISKTTNSLHIDLQGVVTICVLFTRIFSDVAPLLKVIRLYPFAVWEKPDRRTIAIYVLAVLCLARSIVAVIVGAEFTKMGKANPAVAAKIKAAASKDVTYKFFTVLTPLHMSSLFCQVFYVAGICAMLSHTSWRVFAESRSGPTKRWHRILRLVTECTIMSFIGVLPIRSATWWAFGACTFRRCPWPIVDQNQCNVSVLASLFASVWSSIERPRQTQTMTEKASTSTALETSAANKASADGKEASDRQNNARNKKLSGETADNDVCDIDSILALGPASHAGSLQQRKTRRHHHLDNEIFPLPPPPPRGAPTQAVPFVTAVFGIRL